MYGRMHVACTCCSLRQRTAVVEALQHWCCGLQTNTMHVQAHSYIQAKIFDFMCGFMCSFICDLVHDIIYHFNFGSEWSCSHCNVDHALRSGMYKSDLRSKLGELTCYRWGLTQMQRISVSTQQAESISDHTCCCSLSESSLALKTLFYTCKHDICLAKILV